MPEKMLRYSTPDGDIPTVVKERWEQYGVDYAAEHELHVKKHEGESGVFEIPSIISGSFPECGLLLHQYDNALGNCGKIIIMPGYDAIMEIQEELKRPDGCICTETDYEGGMALPNHLHPPLAYSIDDKFVGPVVEQIRNNKGTLFRVRVLSEDGTRVQSRLYAEIKTPKKVQYLQEPTCMKYAELVEVETDMALTELDKHGYPENLRSLSMLIGGITFKNIKQHIDEKNSVRIHTGKQEKFVGYSKVPIYLGSRGENNLSDYGISVPPTLEENIAEGFRHVELLHEAEVSEKVEWHWLIAGDETSVVAEISGKPDLLLGSEDAGDIFWWRGEDPLFLHYLRKKVLEGH